MPFAVRATLCVLVASCGTTTPEIPLAPIPVREVSRTEVRHQGHRIGELVELELQEPTGSQQFFRIEDAGFRFVGYASGMGHFYRLVPFQDREEFIGMYSMVQGLGRLLEIEGPLELVPLKESERIRRAAEAAARRAPPQTGPTDHSRSNPR